MEDNTNYIESLLEKAADYGKTSYELVKLKVIDKTSDVVSSYILHFIVFFTGSLFMLFLNLGLAFWLGYILGKIWYGFFVIAAFYGILGIVIHFFIRKSLKKLINNYIIRLIIK